MTHTLVWYEPHENMESAILREKEVKKWQHHAKITLIEKIILNGGICGEIWFVLNGMVLANSSLPSMAWISASMPK